MAPLPIVTSACMIEPSGAGILMRSTPSNALFRKSMNCAAGRTMMYGVMAVNPGRWYCTVFALASPVPAADAALPSLMDALLCKSDFNAARNSSPGSSRNTCATRVREASSRSGVSSGRGCSDTSIHCTTSSSCNARERLAMAALHLRPQILYGAQLQLLYGAFRLPQALSNLSNASLLHKSLVDHLLLNLRKPPHQPEQLGAILGCPHLGSLQVGSGGPVRRIVGGRELARGSFGMVDDAVRGNPQQPRHKWHAPPLVTRQAGQRPMKHFRCQIFRGRTLSHAARNERIHALEMQLVQHIKLCRVALRRLHKQALLRLPRRTRLLRRAAPQPRTLAHRSSCGHLGSNNITIAREKGHASRKARSRQDMLERIGRTAVPL